MTDYSHYKIKDLSKGDILAFQKMFILKDKYNLSFAKIGGALGREAIILEKIYNGAMYPELRREWLRVESQYEVMRDETQPPVKITNSGRPQKYSDDLLYNIFRMHHIEGMRQKDIGEALEVKSGNTINSILFGKIRPHLKKRWDLEMEKKQKSEQDKKIYKKTLD